MKSLSPLSSSYGSRKGPWERTAWIWAISYTGLLIFFTFLLAVGWQAPKRQPQLSTNIVIKWCGKSTQWLTFQTSVQDHRSRFWNSYRHTLHFPTSQNWQGWLSCNQEKSNLAVLRRKEIYERRLNSPPEEHSSGVGHHCRHPGLRHPHLNHLHHPQNKKHSP